MAPSSRTIVKGLLTTTIVPGTFMTLMGLGLVPVDDGVVAVAAPFIEPLGIPFRAFVRVLGPSKILAALSLWKVGPMPEWFARIGLMASSCCALYGHGVLGEPVVAPLAFIGLISSLYVMDHLDAGKEGKKE